MSKTNPCPKWAEKFISARSLFVVEESVVDPKAKTLTTYTRNISCQNYMTIDEKVVYRPSQDDSGWTVVERTAWITSSYGYGLARAVEAFGVDRFRKNIVKANKGFQIVLDALYAPKEDHVKDSIITSNLFHPWLKARLLRDKAAIIQANAAKVSPLMTAAAMSTDTWLLVSSRIERYWVAIIEIILTPFWESRWCLQSSLIQNSDTFISFDQLSYCNQFDVITESRMSSIVFYANYLTRWLR